MIRDFVTILYGEEVVIILVTASFFLGLSLGYFFSLKFSEKFFINSFLAIVFLHLTFPFSYRMFAAGIARYDLGGYVYILLMFVYAFIFSSIFAVFLTRLVHEKTASEKPAIKEMKVLYSLELAGFASGFMIVGLSWNKGIGFILSRAKRKSPFARRFNQENVCRCKNQRLSGLSFHNRSQRNHPQCDSSQNATGRINRCCQMECQRRSAF